MLGPAIHSATEGGKITRVLHFDETPVRAILLDIEGTTTPVEFVTKTLFPYASRKLEVFLRQNAKNAEIRAPIEELRTQRGVDERNGLKPPSWRDDSEEELVRSGAAQNA